MNHLTSFKTKKFDEIFRINETRESNLYCYWNKFLPEIRRFVRIFIDLLRHLSINRIEIELANQMRPRTCFNFDHRRFYFLQMTENIAQQLNQPGSSLMYFICNKNNHLSSKWSWKFRSNEIRFIDGAVIYIAMGLSFNIHSFIKCRGSGAD